MTNFCDNESTTIVTVVELGIVNRSKMLVRICSEYFKTQIL